jgi:hypothetical protein
MWFGVRDLEDIEICVDKLKTRLKKVQVTCDCQKTIAVDRLVFLRPQQMSGNTKDLNDSHTEGNYMCFIILMCSEGELCSSAGLVQFAGTRSDRGGPIFKVITSATQTSR